MELKDFVARSLIDIIEGVKLAQETSHSTGAMINPSGHIFMRNGFPSWEGIEREPIGQMVEFDIAVTTTDGSQLKGGVGVGSPIIVLGYQAKKEGQNSMASRIKFSVPVFLPRQNPKK